MFEINCCYWLLLIHCVTLLRIVDIFLSCFGFTAASYSIGLDFLSNRQKTFVLKDNVSILFCSCSWGFKDLLLIPATLVNVWLPSKQYTLCPPGSEGFPFLATEAQDCLASSTLAANNETCPFLASFVILPWYSHLLHCISWLHYQCVYYTAWLFLENSEWGHCAVHARYGHGRGKATGR